MVKTFIQLTLIPCVLVTVCLSTANSIYAWSPVVHYVIAEELGTDPKYANLPDAWPSNWASCVITEKFCWAHGVQDAGKWNAPTYPNDGRWPEYDMRILAKCKLKNPSATAQKTIEGFAVHNGADIVVHFSYFQGGQTTWRHHVPKEEWADLVIFAWKKCKIDFLSTGDFAKDDYAKIFDTDERIQTALRFETKLAGDAFLLHLAQEVYIKNGRKTDADGTGPLDVDSADEVNAQIKWFNDNYGRVLYRDGMRSKWVAWHKRAVSQGWPVGVCMVNYELAKASAKRRLDFVKSKP